MVFLIFALYVIDGFLFFLLSNWEVMGIEARDHHPLIQWVVVVSPVFLCKLIGR